MRSLLFWNLTRRRLVVNCGRFETTCPSHLQGSGSVTAAYLADIQGQFSVLLPPKWTFKNLLVRQCIHRRKSLGDEISNYLGQNPS
jgi:hypothetical protein